MTTFCLAGAWLLKRSVDLVDCDVIIEKESGDRAIVGTAILVRRASP